MRFDESSRLRELVSQMRARREQAITGNGHGLAMAAASAGMSPLAQFNHQLSGMQKAVNYEGGMSAWEHSSSKQKR